MLKYLRILPIFAFELFFKKINLFIVLAMVNLHCCTWAFLSCCEQGLLCYCDQASHSSGFSCCRARTLRRAGFSRCRLWTQKFQLAGSRVQASYGVMELYLWSTGLVAPKHVESSRTRDWTGVSCIARKILNHWTTREALHLGSYG